MNKSTHLLFLWLILFTPTVHASCWDGFSSDDRPAEKVNNIWYHENDSDTVFVFVHGILSDSRDAWMYEKQGNPSQYWPAIVRDCEYFNSPSVYLGGYHTSLSSGQYDMRDAANELARKLRLVPDGANRSVMDYDHILFIAHSTGGILVRHILFRQVGFRDKTIGLALMASPSLGSKDADRLELFMKIANHRMGQQLQHGNIFLGELDSDFKNLVDQRTLTFPGLVGSEALENHFVLPGIIFGTREVVVTEESGGRYFGEPIRIADTNHFSIVKPNNQHHGSISFLRDFYESKFLPAKSRIELQRSSLGKYKFTTPYEDLRDRAQVGVYREQNRVALVPFEQLETIDTGLYDATVLLDARETLNKSFQVNKNQESVVAFNHKAEVSGKVLDGQARGVANVSVTILGQQFVTGNDGVYVILDLPIARRYTIVANSSSGKVTTGTIYNRNWVLKISHNIIVGDL